MTLGFMQNWPKSMAMQDDKTYFIEKIWTSLTWEPDYYSFRDEFKEKFKSFWDGSWTDEAEISFHPKLHTIRHDEGERWKPGMDIHFVINSRTKDRFQFAPVVKCKSVQTIEIEYQNKYTVVRIDGRSLSYEEIKQLAANDGFDYVWDFFKYFDKDFKGRLIHWTNLRY